MMFCNAKNCRQICQSKKGCHKFRNSIPITNPFRTTDGTLLNTKSMKNLLNHTTVTYTEPVAVTTHHPTTELRTVSRAKQITFPENDIKDVVNTSGDNSVGETKTANLSVGNLSSKSFGLDVRILSFVIPVALILVSRIF